MPTPHRRSIPRPALWIAAPTFIVSLLVAASVHAGIIAVLVIAALGALAIGIFAERRLARIISSFDRIARGDRYTTLPNLVGDADGLPVMSLSLGEAEMPAYPMEASWLGFHLWTQSVQAAGTTDVAAVRLALAGRSIRAPSRFDIVVDAENQHLHKPSIIGRMDEKNVIWPVWTSKSVVAPEPWSQWLATASVPVMKKAG